MTQGFRTRHSLCRVHLHEMTLFNNSMATILFHGHTYLQQFRDTVLRATADVVPHIIVHGIFTRPYLLEQNLFYAPKKNKGVVHGRQLAHSYAPARLHYQKGNCPEKQFNILAPRAMR
jgi:hypothetical protein